MNKIISVENLSKSYVNGKFVTKVLDNVTLDVYENDIIFIVGPSGAGKTTLLNILGLMDDFDSGNYIFMSNNVKSLSKNEKNSFVRNHIGFLFQTMPLLKELNVYENIFLPARIKNLKQDSDNNIQEICKKLGIQELLKRKITEISTGQRQRVGLASVLVKQPKILFCDEPTANLDNENTQKIIELLNDINKSYGVTIVFTTHNTSLSRFANRIYKIFYGKLENL